MPTADLEVVVDRGLDLGGEPDLGLLGQVPQARHGERIRGRIDPVPIADPIDQVQDDAVVEVVPPEEGVPARGQDLLAGPRNRQDRTVEGAPAEVIDEPALLGRFPGAVGAVGERRGRRLVDDAGDREAGHLPRRHRSTSLRLVEPRRDRDHHLPDHVPDRLPRACAFEIGEDLGGHLDRRELLPAKTHAVVLLAHVAFDRAHRVVGFQHGVVGRAPPAQPLASVEGHHRGHGGPPVDGDDLQRTGAREARDAAIGGAEIDAVGRSFHDRSPPGGGPIGRSTRDDDSGATLPLGGDSPLTSCSGLAPCLGPATTTTAGRTAPPSGRR